MKIKQFRGKHAAVLSYLKSHRKGGTVFEMQEKLKFGDIRKKISDLRFFYKIVDVWENYCYPSGEVTRVKRYILKGQLQ